MGTFRDTFSSRQINLIDLPCTKNARRIFAIVSKISIPTSASKNHGSHCEPSAPGSRLDADHPENGVLIPCRFTRTCSQSAEDGATRPEKDVIGVEIEGGKECYVVC